MTHQKKGYPALHLLLVTFTVSVQQWSFKGETAAAVSGSLRSAGLLCAFFVRNKNVPFSLLFRHFANEGPNLKSAAIWGINSAGLKAACSEIRGFRILQRPLKMKKKKKKKVALTFFFSLTLLYTPSFLLSKLQENELCLLDCLTDGRQKCFILLVSRACCFFCFFLPA